jgi:hypothetical protein
MMMGINFSILKLDLIQHGDIAGYLPTHLRKMLGNEKCC